jgi:outer membrane protein OmpA-like peptidoglycan-associated protein
MGFRAEDCRVAAGPARVAREKDRDGDGVPDSKDACVDEPGLRDADSKRNGCPMDRDGDGIWDRDDACPTVPGDKSKDEKLNGCPADADQDGIIDKWDACPDIPGEPSDKARLNGCPADRDGDGIRDKLDACPDEKGDRSDDPKLNGCPGDRDHDGVPDSLDVCPDLPGEKNADSKLSGCPPPKVTKERIEIGQRIEFEVGRAVLLPESTAVLDAVAKVILAHPEIALVVVEGHTDNTDSAESNLALSQQRAEAVRDYLVKQGVPGKLLEAEGYGMSRPIADNSTEEGRRKNRRVEFKVVMEEPEPEVPVTPEKPAP